MSAPTAVLAEDEPLLRGELKEMLAAQWPELVICAEAEDGPAAVQALDDHAPAVMFLDIEMPGLSGLEVAQRASGRCHVVFVTAYDKYAVAAFEQGAVDYVMKPFSAARLDATISRLRQRLLEPPADLTGILRSLATTLQRKDYLRWITAAQGDSLRVITVDEICYFRADHKYTLVVTADSEALIRRPLKALAEEVDPQSFWQIHRSALVNVNAIAGVNRDVRGHLHVKLKARAETLPVGESYVHLFKQM
jgi:DNA-binding LytR/AlgR family response regulator